MALSSLDPKPARLDRNWNCEYSPGVSIIAFFTIIWMEHKLRSYI